MENVSFGLCVTPVGITDGDPVERLLLFLASNVGGNARIFPSRTTFKKILLLIRLARESQDPVPSWVRFYSALTGPAMRYSPGLRATKIPYRPYGCS